MAGTPSPRWRATSASTDERVHQALDYRTPVRCTVKTAQETAAVGRKQHQPHKKRQPQTEPNT